MEGTAVDHPSVEPGPMSLLERYGLRAEEAVRQFRSPVWEGVGLFLGGASGSGLTNGSPCEQHHEIERHRGRSRLDIKRQGADVPRIRTHQNCTTDCGIVEDRLFGGAGES